MVDKNLLKVQEHIGKISWSLLDKGLFFLYGILTIYQVNAIDTDEFGIYALMISVVNWILVFSDSFALQGLIQFGADKSLRPKVNFISLVLLMVVGFGVSFLVFAFGGLITELFNEERFQLVSIYLPLLIALNIPRVFSLKLLYRDHKFFRVFLSNLAYFGMMGIMTFVLIGNGLNFNEMANIYISGAFLGMLVTVLLSMSMLSFAIKGEFYFRSFLKFSMPMTLIAGLYAIPRHLDIYVIQLVGGASSAGIYYLAKTLYRVFEEITSAAHGLIYPPAVKLLNRGDNVALSSLMTKATSFLFVTILVIVILIQLLLNDSLVSWFLPEKFFPAISFFKVLSIAALFIPFYLLSLIIVASGKVMSYLKYIIYSILVAALMYTFSIWSGNEYTVPFGLIIFNLCLGVLCYRHIKQELGFPVSQVFRSITDSWHFVKETIKK